MVAPPKKRAPHKAIHYRTRDKGQFRNGSKSGGPEGGDIQDEKESSPENINTTKHNQQLLDIFRNTYYELLTSSDFTPKLQAVKQALFERDFAKAFGDPENLEIYAARWSPTRALCYASVFAGIKDKLDKILTPLPPPTTSQQSSAPSEDTFERTTSSSSSPPSEDTSKRTPSSSYFSSSSSPSENPEEPSEPEESTSTHHHHHHHHLQVLSIGGCAAELVAFGSLLSAFPPSTSGSLTLLDSGPWEDVIASLTSTITTPPPVSKYASAAAKARGPGTALIHPPSRLLSSTFLQKDVLALGPEGLSSIIGGDDDNNNNKPALITLLFTLNELFTASGIGKTTKFLLDLTSVAPFGSLLLVVDSPGSYSETTIGKEESKKKYPMQWLLDRIILGTQKEPVAGRRWKKLESHDSVWFRLDQREKKLDYPIALENMRYQMHLYRVVDASLPEEDSDDE
ncbi:hypothetical protein QBC43DRAFT_319379 [Cladorrhinum sp. PSN259]|nr:hypothetical protein QBC43DRAFT_319379 [Cladorrhinum sp. PSN259]